MRDSPSQQRDCVHIWSRHDTNQFYAIKLSYKRKKAYAILTWTEIVGTKSSVTVPSLAFSVIHVTKHSVCTRPLLNRLSCREPASSCSTISRLRYFWRLAQLPGSNLQQTAQTVMSLNFRNSTSATPFLLVLLPKFAVDTFGSTVDAVWTCGWCRTDILSVQYE